MRSVRVLKPPRMFLHTVDGIYYPTKLFWDLPWPHTPPKRPKLGVEKLSFDKTDLKHF